MHTRNSLAVLAVLLVASSTQAADYRKLFEESNPSVVVLYTIERQIAPHTESGEVALDGLGSGFVVDEEGHVMTAAHVVQTADLVQVEFVDGTKVTAAVVASDPVKDVALLKLDIIPPGMKPAKLGDSEEARVGDEIFVIGAPYGLTHTLTVGHISARHKNESGTMGVVRAETFQTDAAINQGNSGGPMFNQRGEVIGIVSYIRSQTGGSVGLGFAVTSNAAVEALIEERLTWSGMSGTIVTGVLARAMNVPQQSGYLVQKVAASSPAARLGLLPSKIPAIIGEQQLLIGGDIILAIEGVEITPDIMSDMRRKLPKIKRGQIVNLRILRAGKIITLSAPF